MNFKKIIILAICISTSFSLLSCGKKAVESKTNQVVLEYKGQTLTYEGLVDYVRIRHRMERNRFYFGREGQIRAAKDYILQTYFSEEARNKKFQVPNFEELVQASLRPVMNQGLVDENTTATKITDKEVKEYYDAHTTEFFVPESVHVRHIFIEIPQDATSAKKLEILKKMQFIRQKALKGEDFATLANQYSEVQSKDAGGDVGYIVPGQIKTKSFEDMAFSLETGKISPIVETIYGYHILRVEDRKLSRLLTFQEVKQKGGLKQFLEQRQRNQATDKYINELISRTSVVRYYDRIPQYLQLSPETPIFTVGERIFSVKDFRESAVLKFGIKENQPITDNQQRALLRLMDNMVVDEVLYQEAKRLHFEQRPSMVKARKVIEDFILAESYKDILLNPDKTITLEDMKKYYEANKARFKTENMVEACQIYISAGVNSTMLEGEKKRAMAAAKIKADDVCQKITKGSNFAEMAKKYSQDEFASKGGYVGVLEYGQSGALFDINAFKLNPGEVSDPIEFHNGYLIIKVDKKIPSKQIPYEGVTDRIRKFLTYENQQKLRTQTLTTLLNEKKAILYEERI